MALQKESGVPPSYGCDWVAGWISAIRRTVAQVNDYLNGSRSPRWPSGQLRDHLFRFDLRVLSFWLAFLSLVSFAPNIWRCCPCSCLLQNSATGCVATSRHSLLMQFGTFHRYPSPGHHWSPILAFRWIYDRNSLLAATFRNVPIIIN